MLSLLRHVCYRFRAGQFITMRHWFHYATMPPLAPRHFRCQMIEYFAIDTPLRQRRRATSAIHAINIIYAHYAPFNIINYAVITLYAMPLLVTLHYAICH